MGTQDSTVPRDDTHVRIELDIERSLIRTEWKGYVPSVDYRTILLQVLELVKTNRLLFWLSDSRRMGAILHDDEHWSIHVLTPLIMDAGLRRVAVINSADFFSQTAAERMVEATAAIVPFKVTFFDELDKADAWLMLEHKVLA